MDVEIQLWAGNVAFFYCVGSIHSSNQDFRKLLGLALTLGNQLGAICQITLFTPLLSIFGLEHPPPSNL